MSTLTKSTRHFLAIALLAAALAPAAVVVSPSVVPQVASAVTCTSTAPSAPVRISGPAVRATGQVTCNSSVYQLQVRIQIFAKDCGTCSYYLFADSGYLNCGNCSSNTRSHWSYCSGTRTYFAHVYGRYNTNGGAWIAISGKSSWATVIPC